MTDTPEARRTTEGQPLLSEPLVLPARPGLEDLAAAIRFHLIGNPVPLSERELMTPTVANVYHANRVIVGMPDGADFIGGHYVAKVLIEVVVKASVDKSFVTADPTAVERFQAGIMEGPAHGFDSQWQVLDSSDDFRRNLFTLQGRFFELARPEEQRPLTSGPTE